MSETDTCKRLWLLLPPRVRVGLDGRARLVAPRRCRVPSHTCVSEVHTAAEPWRCERRISGPSEARHRDPARPNTKSGPARHERLAPTPTTPRSSSHPSFSLRRRTTASSISLKTEDRDGSRGLSEPGRVHHCLFLGPSSNEVGPFQVDPQPTIERPMSCHITTRSN